MIDFAAARRMMVDGQVRTSDVTDPRIIAAMLELPRERFVPEDRAGLAYLDFDVPVAGDGGRTGAPPAQADGAGQAGPGGGGRGGRPRARCRLRHRLFVGAAGTACRLGGRARGGSRLGPAGAARISRAVGAQQCHGRDRPADRRAGRPRRPTTSFSSTAPPRSCRDALCRQLKDGGRLVAVMGGAPAGRAMLYRSVGGRCQRTAGFRRLGAAASRICRAAGIRVLSIGGFRRGISHSLGVARKHQAPPFRKCTVSRRVPGSGPIMVNFAPFAVRAGWSRLPEGPDGGIAGYGDVAGCSGAAGGRADCARRACCRCPC